ncbi:hypothetical protein GCM10023347_18440 [Streptomyces chumphonensis]|uniref:DUF2304 domain-containing protein n=1 Tax=Streptomyces chumphonensis TaxID=1214925 RepID=A0A927EZ93_9ACTN|nr:hypothetical protein [Streptomyces chumphonensis]MBD3931752.1 hypothetical protein [Streptomyces chumphonensis]
MVLSISGVVLFGVIGFLLFRKGELKPSHAAVCALFGFYLSGTAVGPGIQAGSDKLASLLGGITL